MRWRRHNSSFKRQPDNSVGRGAALNGRQGTFEPNASPTRGRRDWLVASFARAGWDIPPPAASMFAWAPIPEQFRHLGSMEFAKRLLAHVRSHQASARKAKAAKFRGHYTELCFPAVS
jgi:hypothetical protein